MADTTPQRLYRVKAEAFCACCFAWLMLPGHPLLPSGALLLRAAWGERHDFRTNLNS
jgi:hypothetical protein